MAIFGLVVELDKPVNPTALLPAGWIPRAIARNIYSPWPYLMVLSLQTLFSLQNRPSSKVRSPSTMVNLLRAIIMATAAIVASASPLQQRDNDCPGDGTELSPMCCSSNEFGPVHFGCEPVSSFAAGCPEGKYPKCCNQGVCLEKTKNQYSLKMFC